VKFNPNLYADGKVCLSLLGTHTGLHQTEKWDPAHSSLYQVLVSIQSQTLIAHPIVNEPGYDGKEASSQSVEYNAKIRLWTMRHAMTEQIRNPPVGFAEVVRTFFASQRRRILRQCWQWTDEAPAELKGKMVAALAALHAALPEETSEPVVPVAAGADEGGDGDDGA
jgi:hypothetical protein